MMHEMKIAVVMLLAASAWGAGCATEAGDNGDGGLSKAEAAALMSESAKADNATDLCETNGWYGDGVCDEFCAKPDPDCGGGSELCDVGEGCGEGQVCLGEITPLCVPEQQVRETVLDRIKGDFPEFASGSIETTFSALRRGRTQPGAPSVIIGYSVQAKIDDARTVQYDADMSGTLSEPMRMVPEDLRETAPWGPTPWIVPGQIMLTIDASMSFNDLRELLEGPVVRELKASRMTVSSDGKMAFLTLEVNPLDELELIAKMPESDLILEAWPNRLMKFNTFGN